MDVAKEFRMRAKIGSFFDDYNKPIKDGRQGIDLSKSEWCEDRTKILVMQRAIEVLGNEFPGLVFMASDLEGFVGEIKFFLPEDEEGLMGIYYSGEMETHKNGFKSKRADAFFYFPLKY